MNGTARRNGWEYTKSDRKNKNHVYIENRFRSYWTDAAVSVLNALVLMHTTYHSHMPTHLHDLTPTRERRNILRTMVNERLERLGRLGHIIHAFLAMIFQGDSFLA